MRGNTQLAVATHVLMLVGAYGNDIKVTSDFISGSAGINPVLIRNIFTKLKKAGILLTSAGRGQTRLARPAAEITLWDIYTAVESESSLDIFKIHRNTSPECPVGRFISANLVTHLDDAVLAMRAKMSQTTLATLIAELKANEKRGGKESF